MVCIQILVASFSKKGFSSKLTSMLWPEGAHKIKNRKGVLISPYEGYANV